MNTNTPRKFNIGQQLTETGCPSNYCTIIDNTECVIKNGEIQGTYKVQFIGSSSEIDFSAKNLHQFYYKSTTWEKKNAVRIDDPDEPSDPNFDADGMPIYRPDHI